MSETVSNGTKEKGFKPSAGNEAANSYDRRVAEGFFTKYIESRRVLDVGCGHEKVCEDARGWDLANGDGDCTYLEGVEDKSFDTVYASHVLEHVEDPVTALNNWWRVLEEGGHLIIAVPDEDLYEQGLWPSMFNSDHRHRFTIHKDGNSNGRVNLIDLVRELPGHKVEYVKVCDTNYDYERAGKGPVDQGGAERQIEMVVRKVSHVPPRNTIKHKFKCGCGGDRLIIKGVDIAGRIRIKCLECGQLGALGLR